MVSLKPQRIGFGIVSTKYGEYVFVKKAPTAITTKDFKILTVGFSSISSKPKVLESYMVTNVENDFKVYYCSNYKSKSPSTSRCKITVFHVVMK